MAIYILSIKPYFAKQIYRGVKKYELRRKVGEIKPYSILIIYESKPVKAITGIVEIGEVKVLSSKTVEALILSGKLEGCKAEDIEYVKGERDVLILEIMKKKCLKKPITLKELRALIPRFNPPLSYFRIDNKPKYDKLIKVINEFLN